MGIPFSTQSTLSADGETKVYRQLRHEYATLIARGVTDETIIYQTLSKRHAELEALYSTSSFSCPRVRFGRTNLQMPIITCGGMRMQQTWAPKEGVTLEDINKDCQANFEKIVDRAMQLGINHFETARGYGTSELQYGPVLKKYSRDSYILQTKVGPKEDPAEFRAALEKSFTSLQLDGEGDYVDLLSIHGINRPEHIEWCTKSGGCLDILREYQRAGKLRWIGFSTHAVTPVIVQAIETGQFDYVNVHYQFIGSYTASGTGDMGGNASVLLAAQRHDMGVFIISATDKGGALYEPPQAFAKACQPLTPIAFQNLWLWSNPLVHTLVVGAARPADFDEHVQAALLYDQRVELVAPIETKLRASVSDVFGPTFQSEWFTGLPDAFSNDEGVPVGYIYWLWWISKVWGMHNFALKRYVMLEANIKEWDDAKPASENQKKFSWAPGLAFRPKREQQLRDVLASHPRGEEVVAAIKEAHHWFHSGGCVRRGEEPGGGINVDDWAIAYNLQPDIPFPERK